MVASPKRSQSDCNDQEETFDSAAANDNPLSSGFDPDADTIDDIPGDEIKELQIVLARALSSSVAPQQPRESAPKKRQPITSKPFSPTTPQADPEMEGRFEPLLREARATDAGIKGGAAQRNEAVQIEATASLLASQTASAAQNPHSFFQHPMKWWKWRQAQKI